jgi:hypothetical protein
MAHVVSDPKEKILHTRVPEALEAEIKALAEALRVPVSGLVRNILEDSVRAIHETATGLDDTIKTVKKNVETFQKNRLHDTEGLRRGWAEFQSMLQDALRPPKRESSPPKKRAPASSAFAEVFGWQPITLNVAASCAGCGAHLGSGQRAHLGLTDVPGRRVLACAKCLASHAT